MTKLRRIAATAVRVGRSLPGKLAAASLAVTLLTPVALDTITEGADVFGWDPTWLTSGITVWSTRIVALLGIATTVYARVTEVPDQLRGVTPVDVEIKPKP